MVINAKRVIAEAKQEVLRLNEEGYSQPAHRKDIHVLGKPVGYTNRWTLNLLLQVVIYFCT